MVARTAVPWSQFVRCRPSLHLHSSRTARPARRGELSPGPSITPAAPVSLSLDRDLDGARSDSDGGVWSSPARRTKGNREHRVPLYRRALEILEEARALSRSSRLVFPSRGGKPFANTTLSELLRELKIAAVPHGFRSGFRDWAAEETDQRRLPGAGIRTHGCRRKVRSIARLDQAGPDPSPPRRDRSVLQATEGTRCSVWRC